MTTTERRRYLREADFLRAVVDLLVVRGWLVYHVDNSTRLIRKPSGIMVRVRNTPRGFPDLCAVRERDARLLFAELKRDVGPRGGGSRVAVRPEQADWLRALRRVQARTIADELHAREASRPASAEPALGVYVWRPADWPEIERVTD